MTRFRGYPTTWEGGSHDGEEPPAVPGGVSSSDRRPSGDRQAADPELTLRIRFPLCASPPVARRVSGSTRTRSCRASSVSGISRSDGSTTSAWLRAPQGRARKSSPANDALPAVCRTNWPRASERRIWGASSRKTSERSSAPSTPMTELRARPSVESTYANESRYDEIAPEPPHRTERLTERSAALPTELRVRRLNSQPSGSQNR